MLPRVLNLDPQNQAMNISDVLLSSQIKLVKGFMSYDRTYKQTDEQRLQLYTVKPVMSPYIDRIYQRSSYKFFNGFYTILRKSRYLRN